MTAQHIVRGSSSQEAAASLRAECEGLISLGLQAYSDTTPVLWDELDASGLQGGSDGTEGARAEDFAALQARDGVGGHLRRRGQVSHAPRERDPRHTALNRQNGNRVTIFLHDLARPPSIICSNFGTV